MAFLVLTTNVTGHVALFAEKLANGDFRSARIVGLWMLLFLLGAFVCSLIINKVGKNQRFAYTIPILIEIGILLFVGSCGPMLSHTLVTTEILAGSLLFAMGLQNAMVSMISGSVVRTTHLTGMFTDLGIELAAIIRLKSGNEVRVLRGRIYLRVVIIVFFFLGCIFGAIFYNYLKLRVFYIPASILFIAMFFDIFRIKAIKAYRNVKHLIHHTS